MTPNAAPTELNHFVRSFRKTFIALGVFTAIINVLGLSGSIFMLAVYDYALPSSSIPTLLGLILFLTVLYGFYACLDALRSVILAQVSGALDEALNARVFDLITRISILNPKFDASLVLRDIDNLRMFFASNGVPALLDLPWIPFYMAICFALHPLLGVVALAGALLILAIAVLNEYLSRRPAKEAQTQISARNRMAESARRNAEVIAAMGMTQPLLHPWSDMGDAYRRNNVTAGIRVGTVSSVSRVARMMLQSMVLATGAFLVIRHEASSGIMIAASTLAARALAPADVAIGNWRLFVQARISWDSLQSTLRKLPVREAMMPLPPPRQSLAVEGLTLIPPGGSKPVLRNVSFRVDSGQAVAIIGPSGSGKSSLVRALVGVWPAAYGSVRLDGAPVQQYPHDLIGHYIGYVPQDVELMGGTVAQNICRFDPDATPEKIVTAAVGAGLHPFILRLEDGYNTAIGENGYALSAGQRQRLALARALYGDPFLVVMDEPNSNLDSEGDEALNSAIRSVRNRGGIVILVAHRLAAISEVDRILVLNDGIVQAYDKRDEIVRKLGPARAQPAAATAAQ
jgi:ATP-binding cassette subfamily C protein